MGCGLARRFSSFRRTAARCPAWCANGQPRTRSRCWSSAARMRSSRSSFVGTPVCSSWTATAPTPTVWSWSAGSRATPSPPSFPSPSSPPTTTRNRSRPGSRPARMRSSPASSRRPSSGPDWTPCWSAPSGTSRSIPSTRLPGTTEIEREIRRRLESDAGVRCLLRRPGSLQGVQRPVQLLRRGPGHLPAVPDPARRREGAAGRPRLRGPHRR